MEVLDRIPTKPNRKKITFEDNGEIRYATIEYADEPIENGTPLNKKTFDTIQSELRAIKRSYVGNGEAYREIVLEKTPLAVIFPNIYTRPSVDALGWFSLIITENRPFFVELTSENGEIRLVNDTIQFSIPNTDYVGMVANQDGVVYDYILIVG